MKLGQHEDPEMHCTRYNHSWHPWYLSVPSFLAVTAGNSCRYVGQFSGFLKLGRVRHGFQYWCVCSKNMRNVPCHESDVSKKVVCRNASLMYSCALWCTCKLKSSGGGQSYCILTAQWKSHTGSSYSSLTWVRVWMWAPDTSGHRLHVLSQHPALSVQPESLQK